MAALINKTRLCHALNVLGFIGFSLQLTGMCIFQAREGGGYSWASAVPTSLAAGAANRASPPVPAP